ncbi:MAG: hypothetical protein OXC27_00690 [Caldilineaceae bacterium]|nr:hypothetical protein [Caldilineaceae bacterium]
MSTDVFSDLKSYYFQVAQYLVAEAKQASLLANPTGVGTEREEVYRNFLERHLPKTCDVFLGGYVFDMKGNASKQIDVIVTSINTPTFQLSNQTRSIAPLEGTIAVAEIKSKLDRASLRSALENFAAIPRMPDSEGIVPPQIRVPLQRWTDIPYKIILAYDAIEKERLSEHIWEFYEVNGHIPLERRPNIIHVLGRYMVVRITPEIQILEPDGTPTAEPIRVGQFRWIYPNSDILAIAW